MQTPTLVRILFPVGLGLVSLLSAVWFFTVGNPLGGLVLMLCLGLVAGLCIRWLWRARPWALGEFSVALDRVIFTTPDGPQERTWSEVVGVRPHGRRGIRIQLQEGHTHLVYVPMEDRNYLVEVIDALITRHARDADAGSVPCADGNPKQGG